MPAPSGRFFSGPKGRSDRQNVLMVEGQDDAVFVDTLLFLVGAAPERVGVVYIEGKTKLEINVADLIKSRPFVTGQIRKYAIILDSDQAPEQTLAEAHRALTANGQPTPAHGVFREDAKGVAVGVFLIPSDVEAGDLEKLCLATLGTDGLLTMAAIFWRR